ncbi:MAG: helix-turn-helix domain-containing protein [Candidatus Peregrinibacteria bacterium]|nr:helix-turn-helix domain-containing protein [Candidatus Peregrinibacteria bacterium]MDZ4245195.1 helix-turn-helix domain-containing protein [Candidatus Gracilibacteria bacterium]
MLNSDLQNIGLTKDEAQVYLTIIELGGSYASSIASRSSVPRVNCYHILEKLKKKRLITSYTKDGTKFFVAEPPQVLINQQEEKLELAEKIVPELLKLTNVDAFKPIIRSFEGIEGIKALFDQTLEAKSEVLGYTNLEALGEFLPDYLPEYTKKLVKKNVKARFLSPSTEASRAFLDTFYPKDFPRELVEILFVNPKEFDFENQISIYDNSVAIISLNPDELIGILIESAVYAKTQRAVFNLSWLGATAFVAQ